MFLLETVLLAKWCMRVIGYTTNGFLTECVPTAYDSVLGRVCDVACQSVLYM